MVESNSKSTMQLLEQLKNVYLKFILKSRKLNNSAHKQTNNNKKKLLLWVFKHSYIPILFQAIAKRARLWNRNSSYIPI